MGVFQKTAVIGDLWHGLNQQQQPSCRRMNSLFSFMSILFFRVLIVTEYLFGLYFFFLRIGLKLKI